MVSEVQSLGSMDQMSVTESYCLSAVTFWGWMGVWDCHGGILGEGEILMNGSCVEVGRMAWSRARGDSRSLPYSVQSDLPYAQDTDAIRLGSKFPCGDTGRRV